MAGRCSRRLGFSGVLLLVGVGLSAVASATPRVSAGAKIPTASWVIQTVERPAAPLEATASAGAAPTAAWANVQPGRMRARASCGPVVGEYENAMAYADNEDHYHLSRPGLPANTPGDFLYNLYLTGTMKILATGIQSYASVSVGGSSGSYGSYGGILSFFRFGEQGVLYAVTDTLGGASPNLFAGPRGAMKIYGVVNAPVGGYYTINVRIPARFIFRNFPCNQSPVVDDWVNWIYLNLSCNATVGATSDFSSTFEFSAQNPIVPDPEDSDLPPDGWTFSTASGEIALSSPLSVACATGTGAAYFGAADGPIANLAALDGSTLPTIGRPTGFTHGFFSLDITGLTAGAATVLTITLPAGAPAGTRWCYPRQTAGWSSLAPGDDDGDIVLELALVDGGPGDTSGVDGTINLVGGFSVDPIPQPVWLAAFTASARDDGVDLAWRAEQAAADGFRLTARLGGETWRVPFTAQEDGRFAARDDAGALARGGNVTYELAYAGEILASRTVTLAPPAAPAVLLGAAPNPFNPRTRIAFRLSAPLRVQIGVYDLGGRLITTLADADYGPGSHAVEWTGLDDAGRTMPSGSYVARLLAEGRPQSRLISLVR